MLFVFAFTVNHNGRMSYRSRVIESQNGFQSAQDVRDLSAALAMDCGVTNVTAVNWSQLPEDPTLVDGYCVYLVSYWYETPQIGNQLKAGISCVEMLWRPIRSTADLHALEEYLRARNQCAEVHIINCQAMMSPSLLLLEG